MCMRTSKTKSIHLGKLGKFGQLFRNRARQGVSGEVTVSDSKSFLIKWNEVNEEISCTKDAQCLECSHCRNLRRNSPIHIIIIEVPAVHICVLVTETITQIAVD